MAWFPWEGGRYWQDEDGRKTYHIRRRVNGRRWEVTTHATTERGAMEQLKRFEAEPSAYNPAGAHAEKMALTPALIEAFIWYSDEMKLNSKPWVARQRRIMLWWAGKLKGLDLRQVKLGDHIVPALDSVRGRKPRIATIKAFYSWLQKTRYLIEADENPTLSLPVPQPRPEQWKRNKAIPDADHAAVLLAIDQHWGDLLVILNETGWHTTELLRFAREGRIERHVDGSPILVCSQRKSGEVQRTLVPESVVDVARRVRERGGFSESHFFKAVRKACKKAGIPRFGPGQYRHTVATRMLNAGADPAAVEAFLGHKSPQTTRRFYATLAVVPVPVPLSAKRSGGMAG
jgi:integrase